jgi:hypothetical protein
VVSELSELFAIVKSYERAVPRRQLE